MLKGFKDFIFRGNIVDLAVAVVVGTAFTALVTSFTQHIIQPILAIFGDTQVDGLGFQIISSKSATFVDFGALISAIINFVIVAAVVYFLFVVPMNKVKGLHSKTNTTDTSADDQEAVPVDTQLLTEIRDLLKAQQENAPHKGDIQ